jgi:hypothetical protein
MMFILIDHQKFMYYILCTTYRSSEMATPWMTMISIERIKF